MLNVTERASRAGTSLARVTTTPAHDLRNAPAVLYPAKALLTRVRSLAWAARTRGALNGTVVKPRILFYHRISDETDELAVRPAAFEAQMGELARSGWRAVDVAELVRLMRAGEAGHVVGLSF